MYFGIGVILIEQLRESPFANLRCLHILFLFGIAYLLFWVCIDDDQKILT